jgi:hypothetical protein
MPHFIKTGFWALEQKGYKGWLKLEDIIGGGSSGVVEVTYTALQTLISSSALSPGTIYKITGFNKNMPIGGPSNPNGFLPEVLYDDGTNAGVTIYMQAITKNTLSNDGHGEFYNPVYGDQTTYNNTDGTGLYGIWDGDNPDPLEVPAYTIDQVVFWGGYAWRNVTGNVGTADDVITLSADWEKLPYYNSPHYELVIDAISVDWDNGIVIRRTNVENQITVEFNADQYWWWMGLYSSIQTNPISVMGWGLYSKITPEQLDDDFYGISNVKVINSVCETVNFKGEGFLNIDMDSSYLFVNYIGRNTYISELNFKFYSSFDGNTLIDTSIYNNTLTNGYIINNTFNSGNISTNALTNGYITNNTSTDGIISENTLTSVSYISNNTLDNFSNVYNNILINSNISENTLTSSYITNNALGSNGSIYINTLTNGNINGNTLDNGNINDNTLDNSSININTLNNSGNINSNTLDSSSGISINTLNNSGNISNNTLDSSSGISINTLDGGSISNNTLDGGTINVNTLDGGTINVNDLTNNSNIDFNTLTNNSAINENELTTDCIINNNILTNDSGITTNTLTSGSAIDFNTLQKSSINNTDLLTAKFISNNNLNFSEFIFTNVSKQVRFNNVENCKIISDIGLASFIYDAYYKLIFKRRDSTIRLGYYNNSDVFTVVAVNA